MAVLSINCLDGHELTPHLPFFSHSLRCQLPGVLARCGQHLPAVWRLPAGHVGHLPVQVAARTATLRACLLQVELQARAAATAAVGSVSCTMSSEAQPKPRQLQRPPESSRGGQAIETSGQKPHAPLAPAKPLGQSVARQASQVALGTTFGIKQAG